MNPAIYKIYQDFESRKAAKKVPLSKLFDNPHKPNRMKRIIVLIILAMFLVACSRYSCPVYDNVNRMSNTKKK